MITRDEVANALREKTALALRRIDTMTDEQRAHAWSPSTQMAIALAKKPTYEGTVDPTVIAHRRAKNKAARRARRAARR